MLELESSVIITLEFQRSVNLRIIFYRNGSWGATRKVLKLKIGHKVVLTARHRRRV